MSPIYASIIIRTFDEENHLEQCLNSVFSQKMEKHFEVIIVDSGSTDATLNIASKFSTQIFNLPKNKFSYGRSLNLGCSKAKGKALVFLSAHAIPERTDWLETLLKPLDKDYIAVFGSQKPHRMHNPLVRRFVNETWQSKVILKEHERTWMKYNNTNSAVLSSAWQELPFDEDMRSGEDTLWAKKAMASGKKIRYVQEAAVYHSHDEPLMQFYSRYKSDLYAMTSIAGRHTALLRLQDTAHNFVDDLRYIIKKNYSIRWIGYSFSQNLLKVVACFQVFLTARRSKT